MATTHALRYGLLALFFLAIMTLVESCAFCPGSSSSICKDFENIPLTPLTSQSSQIVFQDPGIVIAIHGTGSAKLTSGKTAKAIKVEQSVDILPFANRATVFLNGWRVNYLTTDHNVLVLGTAILKIRFNLREHKLTWVAMGLIRDDDGKEGYDWTYRFTVC